MLRRVLVIQSEPSSSQTLARYFTERGDQVWQVDLAEKALGVIDTLRPTLVLLDLHLPGSAWLELLRALRGRYPQTQIILTNQYPDFQRELLAKEQGAQVFLRQPFSSRWIEAALQRLEPGDQPAETQSALPTGKLPRVRIPVRTKITIPYILLALIFAMAGAYLVTQVVMDSIEERYTSQLVETGKQSADWMVGQEEALLKTLRLVANSQGVAEFVLAGDAENLHRLILPLAVNGSEELLEVLDVTGASILSLRHVEGGASDEYTATRGDTEYRDWDFVQYVLDRRVEAGLDKSSGLAHPSWGNAFYVSGPILDGQGNLAGVVLVGKTLPSLARQMREDTLAEINLYEVDGVPLASTLQNGDGVLVGLGTAMAGDLLSQQDSAALTRDLEIGSNTYREILGPWETRSGQDMGILGVALAQQVLLNTSQVTRAQIFLMVTLGLLLVIVVGVLLAGQITRPLLRLVRASTQVAQGNLEVKVDPKGNDEVSVLAHSFNAMVAGLQEGSIYRDLLGRTVSPEVREQLRQTFISGQLRLEGQESIATVLMTDIRGFTTLCENVDPTRVFNWLNEYFGELVPIVNRYNGVVNKFDGDAMLAFFGILPVPLTPHDSAVAACQAAAEMMNVIDRLNINRMERGDPPMLTGIGVNTGAVTAGGLGTTDRLHYTIIGDTVNTTQRLEGLTRELFPRSGILVSESTYAALDESRAAFDLERMGIHTVKGKSEHLLVYCLRPPAQETGINPDDNAHIAALQGRFS